MQRFWPQRIMLVSSLWLVALTTSQAMQMSTSQLQSDKPAKPATTVTKHTATNPTTMKASKRTQAHTQSQRMHKPVAHTPPPKWLGELKNKGVYYHMQRNRLELRLPISEHFDSAGNPDLGLLKVLKPIAAQLQANHYQLAEIYQTVDSKHVPRSEKIAANERIKAIMRAMTKLKVENKVVVKAQLKRRSEKEQQQQSHGNYVAITLYQTRQGHGLVY